MHVLKLDIALKVFDLLPIIRKRIDGGFTVDDIK